VAVKLGISPAKQDEVAKVLLNLYDLFLSKDASMVEINPFAEVVHHHPLILVLSFFIWL
jgi:succinyl-CoA synthetase beta subunit